MAPPPGIMGIKAKGQGASTGAPTSGNAFAMYYPASLRIWKQQEETNDLLELWISRAQRGDLLSTNTSSFKPAPHSGAGGVSTWKQNNPLQHKSLSSQPPPDTDPPTTLLGSGGSARAEMLLERLPYLPTILRKSRPLAPSTTATICEIQKITTFHGATGSRGGLEEEGLETLERQPGEQEQWATDKDAPASPRKKKGVRVVESARGRDEESAIAGLAAKGASLVLEDDDIED